MSERGHTELEALGVSADLAVKKNFGQSNSPRMAGKLKKLA